VGTLLHGSLPTRAIVATMALAAALSACRRGPAAPPPVSHQELQTALTSILGANAPPRFVVRTRTGRRLWTATREFYQKRGASPVWFDRGQPRRAADELIDVLRKADDDALDPERYAASDVATWRDRFAHAGEVPADARAAATLDTRLTYLYLQYTNDLVNGVSASRPRLAQQADPFDPVASLESALSHEGVAASLDALRHRDAEYSALRTGLATYRKIAANGGWPALPASTRLKPGERSSVVPVLAKRLEITGDYRPNGAAGGAVYDEKLQDAVKRFEKRHGLAPDGVIGPAVLAELNVPAAVRVKQIALNMERRRWMPRDPGERHIFVNIPEYRLEVRDHGKVPLAMRVVVGKKDSPTPSFGSDMTHIVLAPYWNVPDNIAEQETLPAAMRDPAFLRRTNMEIVDKRGRPIGLEDVDWSDPGSYRFRQRPGESNSLGLVKFMFPNPYNVYLHDTPADALFARDSRAFSHGCVRIEEPQKLAEYVLSDRPDWTPDRIAQAMHATTQTAVPLREKIPVYIVYQTARASSDGQVYFFRDVYGKDK
jgi:murein L,D-transpeptidase YcbB/YkuD